MTAFPHARRPLLTLPSLAILILLAAPPASGKSLDDLTKEQWREDLDFLATKLPKKHAAPFARVSREAFDQAVADLGRRLPSLAAHEAAASLARIVAMLGDGHTELWLRQPAAGFSLYPIGLSYFGDDLRVYYASPEHAGAVGRKVLAIGDVDAAEAYARVEPLLARDNEMELIYAAPLYLVLPEVLHALGIIESMESASMTLEGDAGEPMTISLSPLTFDQAQSVDWKTAPALAGAETPLYLQDSQFSYWYKWLEDERTVFVKYNRCQDQKGRPSIGKFARGLFEFVDSHPVEKIVIDVRHNPGGNYHRNTPLIEGISERPNLNRKGRVFVLVGRRTFSAATQMLIDMAKSTEATFLGEPSRGRPNGTQNYEVMRLPNSKLEVGYTNRLHAPAPELGDAPFFPIDRRIEVTMEDYRLGRDPVLEAALSGTGGD